MDSLVARIVRKELKDGLRDKRALMTLFLLPLFLLALMYGVILFLLTMQEKSESFTLPVQGAQYAEPLISWLREEGVDISVVDGDPVQQVSGLQEEFVLVIGKNFPQQFRDFKDAKLELVFDRSRSNIQGRVNRVKQLVYQWSGRIGSLRLVARGVSPKVANPVMLEDVDVANDQKLASKIFAIIPYMLVMTIFTSSIGLSVDMMAGEREKHSLEPLLLNPVSREMIVLGKWLAAILCTLVVLLMTCAAIFLVVPTLPLEKLGLQYQVSGMDLIQATLVAIPLICLATIIQLLVSIFAKSFKEAQSYISLLVMVPMVLAYYILFTEVSESWQAWVPILGSVTVMEAVFTGESVSPQHWLTATAVSLVLALAIGAVLVRQLKREKIIYG